MTENPGGNGWWPKAVADPMCWVCSELCRCLLKVWAQAICHRASVFKVAYAIGVLPRAKQFDPHLGFLGSTIDNVFLLGGTESFIVAPEFPVGRVSGLGV